MADWAAVRHVLFEDDAALVLNKPAGISVMGERHETDLVRLAADAGEPLFPAHRIDKVTSGAILFARAQRFHGDLTRQFNKRTVDKAYLAVTRTAGLPETGTIDLPLSVGRKNRVRIAAERDRITVADGVWSVAPGNVFTHVRSYPSVTAFATVWADDDHTLLVVRPLTGRRHQIRVHLAWIGHALVGDPLFDRQSAGRTLLHSWRLGFDAAWRDQRITVTAPPGDDFWAPFNGNPTLLDTAAGKLDLLPAKGIPSTVDDGTPGEE
jgi:tRNA pseudouridine32 synthase/23S rRNA pseudouridine746 synthase/23S rRNA pseudouridine1911/1915/1917 synthase